MTLVIDGLLDVSRMDAGDMAPQWTEFPLDALVRECCAPLRIVAQAKDLAFETDIAPVHVRSDRVLLARALTNLVSNAIHCTHAGAVRVVARCVEQRVRLSVEDTGIGIAPEHLTKIFDAFYQVGNPGRDRRLAWAWVCDGATHRRTAGAGTQRAFRAWPGQRLRRRAAGGGPAGAGHGRPSARHRQHAFAVARRQVLVVDDDADSRDAMVDLLASWGCVARGAAGAREGLDLLVQGFRPDGLVVDLRLAEGASGIDAVQDLRNAAASPLPALIVTGDAGSDHLQRAQAAGLQVCVKPVRPVQLRAFLAQAFSA